MTEQDILESLPNKKRTLDIMSFTLLLSDRATQRLGNFEKLYQTDPVGKEAVERYHSELNTLNKTKPLNIYLKLTFEQFNS